MPTINTGLGQIILAGPDPEKIRKARMEEALTTAQIARLQREPEQFERQMALDERKLDFAQLEAEASRELQRLGIDVQQRGQDIAVRGQDMDLTGQREGRASAERVAQENNRTQLLSRFFDRATLDKDLDTKFFADVLEREAGLKAAPALLKTLTDEKVSAALPTELTTINAIKDPTARQTYIDSIKDTDLRRAVRAQIGAPGTKPGEAPLPTTPNTTDTPGHIPGIGLLSALKDAPLAAAQQGADILNYGVIPANNLIGSLLGTPPARRVRRPQTNDDLLDRIPFYR